MRKQLPAFLLLAVFGFACCAVVQADSPAAMVSSVPDPAAPTNPIYLTGQESVWSEFPAKPALGSSVDEEDLAITLAAQATRTEDQKKEAMTDRHYTIGLITDVIDPKFMTAYPATFAVLKDADHDAYVITSALKNDKKNQRLRPYVQHPTLVVPLFPVRDFSYPSGHASGTELQAHLVGVLFPSRRDDLFKRARQVADGRVVAGVHYASDTEAGQNLGDLLFDQLKALPKFRDALTAAAQKDGIHSPLDWDEKQH